MIRIACAPGHATAQEKPLDLTLPENLTLIHDDVARIRSWGYDLIKHDYSTYDAFGRWGFEMGAELTQGDWHFNDQSLTNAEIILRLYQTLRAGAGDTALLGCNTIGHLGAGLFEIQRTGDDTSGRVWERYPTHGHQHACLPSSAERNFLRERRRLRRPHRSNPVGIRRAIS